MLCLFFARCKHLWLSRKSFDEYVDGGKVERIGGKIEGGKKTQASEKTKKVNDSHRSQG